MSIGYKSFSTPNGNVQPVLKDGKFKGSFSNTAEFTHGVNETCAPGEYRQYVKGQLKANGSVLTHYLCAGTGVILSEVVYQEDGCGPGYGCTAYGYRACPTGPLDNYTPDQAAGCKFYMSDEPGFNSVTSGVTYTLDLRFKGELVDTATGSTLVTREWTVIGEITVPLAEMASKIAAASLQAQDKIMAVRLRKNRANGAAEIHVVISRPENAPPLDPAAIDLVLTDARGRTVVPSASPAIYEIAGRGGATATIVYSLQDGSHAPVKAEITARGRTATTMDVR